MGNQNGPPRMRLTTTTRLVLEVLMAEASREQYGLEIGQRAQLAPGTVHPILAKLEREGWLTSKVEDADPHVIGRRPRRYYQLTGHGITSATRALQATPTPTSLLRRLGVVEG
jgi:DNA-binding PadR family transcriptional regulator